MSVVEGGAVHHRDYDDIPGTYVFDSRLARQGQALNRFAMSLNDSTNRAAFRQDEAAYLSTFRLSAEQRDLVLERDWLGLVRFGMNIYYAFKLAAHDGRSVQHVGGQMSGVTEDEFRQMMISGGRSPESTVDGKDRRG